MPEEIIEAKYIPGKCNLGEAEINRRYRIGMIGAIASVMLIIFFEIIQPHPLWKLMLFVPLFYALSGFIQGKRKFCYFYGFKQVFSVEGVKTFKRVEGDDARIKDRNTAFNIVFLTFLGSLLLTLLYYWFS